MRHAIRAAHLEMRRIWAASGKLSRTMRCTRRVSTGCCANDAASAPSFSMLRRACRRVGHRTAERVVPAARHKSASGVRRVEEALRKHIVKKKFAPAIRRGARGFQ